MVSATLSSKYQLSLPKVIREQLELRAGQKFSVIAKGDVIELVPVKSIQSARGIFKQVNPNGYRDRS
ncbi:MAG: AbrB/MazE/SpoVT family DNA-binding domain-containing protein [Gammaproteobacteria bacterium]|nr:AbrB/MazE/SpoVT family DNA-binding domain-containing protein [Gammaproteobacteria bacterium]